MSALRTVVNVCVRVGEVGVAATLPRCQLILNGFLNLFFKKKKGGGNALRDFAAFHFMSTNKQTKKPFWREKWERGAGERGGGGIEEERKKKRQPLKNQREIKRLGGAARQEGMQTALEKKTPK